MKAKDFIKECLEHLPNARKAIAEKGNYDGYIESADCMHPINIFCEEENGWYTVEMAHDIVVTDGHIEVVIARCWDGDWDHIGYYDEEDELEDLYKQSEDSIKDREEWEKRPFTCNECEGEFKSEDTTKIDNVQVCIPCYEAILETLEEPYNRIGMNRGDF